LEVREYPAIGEKIWSATLSNGLSVYVVPKPGFQKRFACFAADYGGADRRYRLSGDWVDTPEGVAHFLEHKMFDTEKGDALAALSLNGASPNAYTSTDVTAYHFECTDRFADNLEILLSFVSIPWFTPESVEKEQGIITQEIMMTEDDPDHNLYYGLMKSLFAHNPIRDSVAGTAQSISGITAETLYECHKAFYSPANMVLCVVGDVDPSEVSDIAEKSLPERPGCKPERDYGPPESLRPAAARFTKKMEVSLPEFLAGCKMAPPPGGRDSLRFEITSALALEMLAGHSSRLYLNLYEQGHVNSDFSASFDSAANAAYMMIGGEARDPERVFDEVKNELRKLSGGGLDTGLFSRTIKSAIGSHIRAMGSFEAICGNLIEGHFRGYDAFEASAIIPAITESDIVEFTGKNLRPDDMAISIINPKD